MITIIGSSNCIKCTTTQQTLTANNINYEYYHLQDLPETESEKILRMARNANHSHLPILIKDEKIITISEVLKCYSVIKS